MPKTLYVVHDPAVNLYLVYFNADPARCMWGNSNDAITWETLPEAQSVANSIGGGTVGTTKP